MAMIEKNRRFHASWNTRPCTMDESNDRPRMYTEYTARRCKQAQIMWKTAPIFEIVFDVLIKSHVKDLLGCVYGPFCVRLVLRNNVTRKWSRCSGLAELLIQ